MQRITSRIFSSSRALFAEAAVKKDGFISFSFVTPTMSINEKTPVHMFQCNTTEGEMGVLANHSPFLAQLKPGVVSVYAESLNDTPSKFFVPAGFLMVTEDSSAAIQASEAIPLEDIDAAAVKKALEDAQADLARATDDMAKADASISIEIFSAMSAAIKA